MVDHDELDAAVNARREQLQAGADGLEDADGFVGECREAVPFGETFYVTSGGQEFMSCTHTPPHTRAVT